MEFTVSVPYECSCEKKREEKRRKEKKKEKRKSMNCYEMIDSSAEKDVWLHNAMQKMSISQLDAFFSAVGRLIWGPCDSHEMLSKIVVGGSVFFQTNRIEKKFRLTFQCVVNDSAIQSYLLDFICSVMFLACDGQRKAFLESYRLHEELEKIPAEMKKKCLYVRLALLNTAFDVSAAEKIFGKGGALKKLQRFYHGLLFAECLPALLLLAFGIVSVFGMFAAALLM